MTTPTTSPPITTVEALRSAATRVRDLADAAAADLTDETRAGLAEAHRIAASLSGEDPGNVTFIEGGIPSFPICGVADIADDIRRALDPRLIDQPGHLVHVQWLARALLTEVDDSERAMLEDLAEDAEQDAALAGGA